MSYVVKAPTSTWHVACLLVAWAGCTPAVSAEPGETAVEKGDVERWSRVQSLTRTTEALEVDFGRDKGLFEVSVRTEHEGDTDHGIPNAIARVRRRVGTAPLRWKTELGVSLVTLWRHEPRSDTIAPVVSRYLDYPDIMYEMTREEEELAKRGQPGLAWACSPPEAPEMTIVVQGTWLVSRDGWDLESLPGPPGAKRAAD